MYQLVGLDNSRQCSHLRSMWPGGGVKAKQPAKGKDGEMDMDHMLASVSRFVFMCMDAMNPKPMVAHESSHYVRSLKLQM